jgi:hypothetical protein
MTSNPTNFKDFLNSRTSYTTLKAISDFCDSAHPESEHICTELELGNPVVGAYTYMFVHDDRSISLPLIIERPEGWFEFYSSHMYDPVAATLDDAEKCLHEFLSTGDWDHSKTLVFDTNLNRYVPEKVRS